MTNSIKHKIPKLIFNKKDPHKPFNDLSTLEFEYPEGVKHAYRFFFYPDTIAIYNDITNDVVSAKDLCGNIYQPTANILPAPLTIDMNLINSDLFHEYLEIIVKLFNEQAESVNHDLVKLRYDVSNIMAPYHFIMLAKTFKKETIGIQIIDFTDIEMSCMSSSMIMTINFILSALIDEAHFKSEANQ